MAQANFSESQLQQAVNTAFIHHIFKTKGIYLFAHVPSLFDEFDLGWDTAFYLDWIKLPPEVDHSGCNVFIQYKLSDELSTTRAKEWDDWKKDYYRFQIPFRTKNSYGTYYDDYHQWERLKELADNGYPTFYATNATLDKDFLRESYHKGTLLKEIPVLDVRNVTGLHRQVTFVSEDKLFKLHSDVEVLGLETAASIIEMRNQKNEVNYSRSTEQLIEHLEQMERHSKLWINDLNRIKEFSNFNNRSELSRTKVMRGLLSSFILKHIGAKLMWIPN